MGAENPGVTDAVADAAAGRFRGEAHDGIAVWRGIRYALPPVGPRRWRDPQPAPIVDEVQDALRFGPLAPQARTPALALGPEPVAMDEDCLFLNVWAPAAPAAPAPVMVWIHGGAYTFGSGSQPMYDGGALAAGGVVVVTLNYRIGALGFVDLSSFGSGDVAFDGNLALKDVLLALRWVQANIAAFGGDPDRVTIFGESAGGGLVTTLLATPSAAGLFHRAIAESSPATSVYGPARARRVGERLLAELGGPDPADLRDVPVARLVAAGTAVYDAVPTDQPGTIAFAPVVDGDLVPEPPVTVLREGRGLPVPLIIGTNKDEASFFRFMKSPLLPITAPQIRKMFADMRAEEPDVVLPSEAQVRAAYEGVRHHALGLGIARDIGFRLPALWIAEGHAAPVWLYRFDQATPFLRVIGLGAAHGTELGYVWGHLGQAPRDLTFRLGGRRRAEAVSRRIQGRWLAFAHGGAPDVEGAPDWPAFDTAERATLVIDGADAVENDLDHALRTGWGDRILAFD